MKVIRKPTNNHRFRAGEDHHLNARVGRNGGPYGYSTYAEGYFLAAEHLVRSVRERDRDVDILIYPIIYNVRHGAELWLKHLGRIIPRLWGEVPLTQFSHDLSSLWHSLRHYLCRQRQFDPDGCLVPRMDELIQEIMDADPRGEEFRYPAAKSGQEHLVKFSLINVDVIHAALVELKAMFEWWDFSAEYLWEGICDGA